MTAKKQEFINVLNVIKKHMNIQQIQELTEITKNASIQDFHKFMQGKTIGINKDGTENYYGIDVWNYLKSCGRINNT